MKWISQLKAACFVLALLPLGRLFHGAITDSLGANPIEFITRNLGWWGLTFLLITVSVTPVRRITGWHWLLRLRRMFGLFAFFYVALHFTSYLWWDQWFDWMAIWKDVLKRPFITVGVAAFLMLVPLALTSTNRMIRRLGAQRWQQLHRLVYMICTCGVLHYWWLVKRDITQPLIYAVLLAVLLGFRLWHRRREQRRAPGPVSRKAAPQRV